MASPRVRRVINLPHEPRLWRGRIRKGATKGTDLVTAEIPALFDGTDWITDPMPFNKRPDGVLPAKGDTCLVAIDDQSGEWLLAYEPASGIEHATEP